MYLVEPGTRQTQKQIKISCSFSYSRNPIKETKTNKQTKTKKNLTRDIVSTGISEDFITGGLAIKL